MNLSDKTLHSGEELHTWTTNSLVGVAHHSSFVSLVKRSIEFNPSERIEKGFIADHDFFKMLPADDTILHPDMRNECWQTKILKICRMPWQIEFRKSISPCEAPFAWYGHPNQAEETLECLL